VRATIARGLVPGHQHEIRAFGRERRRDGVADTAAGTRDDRPLAGQLKIHAAVSDPLVSCPFGSNTLLI